jgi:hypothetical protein
MVEAASSRHDAPMTMKLIIDDSELNRRGVLRLLVGRQRCRPHGRRAGPDAGPSDNIEVQP